MLRSRTEKVNGLYFMRRKLEEGENKKIKEESNTVHAEYSRQVRIE